MTIVKEKTLDIAVNYLSEDPHPTALAHKDLLDAETATAKVEGELFLKTEGTVDERKSQVRTHPLYLEAKRAENKASGTLEAHKRREKASYVLIEIWRTENANTRASERFR